MVALPSTVPLLGRPDAAPTRVMIAPLHIDLPVQRAAPEETYPPCDVAEYLPAFGLPGLPGVTYIYAHAQRGMFLALLESSRVDDGRGMLGVRVQLYSDDNVLRTYEVAAVRRGVRSFDVVHAIDGDALVLQTSETSHHTGTKLMIVALPVGAPRLVSQEAAHPRARPRACGT
jgi:hypothetical protein